MTSKNQCPCGSGEPYRLCCRPLHDREREALTPQELMRSRYSAFAMRAVDYLWRTLHRDHVDRAEPPEVVLRMLRDAASQYRYLGLRILEAQTDEGEQTGRVLFVARIFRRGVEHSIYEASHFAREEGAWRYLGGVAHRCRFADAALDGLRLADVRTS